MTPQQLEVAKWMRAFGQETPDAPCVPYRSIIELRHNLIMEEATETSVALYRSDTAPDALAEIADGIADLLVVTYGTAIAIGIDIEPIFTEVMRSNWTKLWATEEVNQQPKEFWQTHSEQLIKDAGWPHCWLVKRNDGKVIKSPSYSPPNLLPLIEAQMLEKLKPVLVPMEPQGTYGPGPESLYWGPLDRQPKE